MTQPYYPPPPQSPAPQNGLGTAALVLGIIGIVLSWIPIVGFLGFILGAIALVLGAVAIVRNNKGVANNKGVTFTGLGLGAASVVISTVVFVAFVTQVDKEVQKLEASAPTGITNVPSPPPSAAPAESGDDTSKVVRLDFGQSHTWSGGEVITVGQPQAYTSDNMFMDAQEGNRLVALDVTILNNSTDEYNASSATFTAQHNGRVAQQNMNSDMLPNVQLPPGGKTTFTLVYEVGGEPGKLQLSVQPNYFAQDTAYFTGQF